MAEWTIQPASNFNPGMDGYYLCEGDENVAFFSNDTDAASALITVRILATENAALQQDNKRLRSDLQILGSKLVTANEKVIDLEGSNPYTSQENEALTQRVRELEALLSQYELPENGNPGECAYCGIRSYGQVENLSGADCCQDCYLERTDGTSHFIQPAPASDEPEPTCVSCGTAWSGVGEFCETCRPVQRLDTEDAVEWLKSNSLADFEASHEYGTYAITYSHNELCCYHCGDPHTKLGFIDEMVLCEQCIDLHIAGDMDWLTQDTGSEAPDATSLDVLEGYCKECNKYSSYATNGGKCGHCSEWLIPF